MCVASLHFETNILSSEMANEHHFRRLGLRMSVLTAPFMQYLPFPITFRNDDAASAPASQTGWPVRACMCSMT